MQSVVKSEKYYFFFLSGIFVSRELFSTSLVCEYFRMKCKTTIVLFYEFLVYFFAAFFFCTAVMWNEQRIFRINCSRFLAVRNEENGNILHEDEILRLQQLKTGQIVRQLDHQHYSRFIFQFDKWFCIHTKRAQSFRLTFHSLSLRRWSATRNDVALIAIRDRIFFHHRRALFPFCILVWFLCVLMGQMQKKANRVWHTDTSKSVKASDAYEILEKETKKKKQMLFVDEKNEFAIKTINNIFTCRI